MARLVTKFKYLKPGARKGVGGYAKYIATREGVDRINDTQKLAPATGEQKKWIEKILRDFPDSAELLEYGEYRSNPNMGNASEFLSRAFEENILEMRTSKTYADYIATRPRAERVGAHGLFTDAGVSVKLSQVSDELNAYTGNVWTVILSMHREDAERLGYNSGERWRDMLRAQTRMLSESFRIPMEHLKWYAAFHNEGHHPHVHMIVYSKVPSEGYLTEKDVQNLRAAFGREIFAQDLHSIYQKQTEYRNTLRAKSRELVESIVEQMNEGSYVNRSLETKLSLLAERLSRTKGKKVYGYLKADVKDLVDSIVRELASDERIASLYELWYEQKEETIRTYTDAIPARIPLEENREFRTIKNAVIQEAMQLAIEAGQVPLEEPQDADTPPLWAAETIPAYTDTPQTTHTTSQPKPRHSTALSTGMIRLLYHLSRMIQQRLQDEDMRQGQIDQKQQRAINDKKQAQGLKLN